MKCSMRTSSALASVILLASPAGAQTNDFLLESIPCSDGTLWAQTMEFGPPRFASGSAQLSAFDTGEPPMGVGMQAAWLEWNPTNVYVGLLGGGLSSAEVLFSGASIANNLGAATLNGGFILTQDNMGNTLAARPCLGSFLWTPTNLYLMALGGGLITAEVTDPTGNSIPDVIGVTVIDSGIFDLSPMFGVVEAHILASVLVWTPSHVYHIDVDLSGGIVFVTSEVFQPGSATPIAKTRGIATVIHGFEFPGLPPISPVVHGAAFVWNDAHVYLVTKDPAVSNSEVFTPGGAPIAVSWGAMTIINADIMPLRGSALILQQNQAWVATILPPLVVSHATLPPGGPTDPPFASGVLVATGPAFLPFARQANALYQSAGRIFVAGRGLLRATILGHDQRTSVPGT